jgi:hypothetical protein
LTTSSPHCFFYLTRNCSQREQSYLLPENEVNRKAIFLQITVENMRKMCYNTRCIVSHYENNNKGGCKRDEKHNINNTGTKEER